MNCNLVQQRLNIPSPKPQNAPNSKTSSEFHMNSDSAVTSGSKNPDEAPSACTTNLRKGLRKGAGQTPPSVKRLVGRGSVGQEAWPQEHVPGQEQRECGSGPAAHHSWSGCFPASRTKLSGEYSRFRGDSRLPTVPAERGTETWDQGAALC